MFKKIRNFFIKKDDLFEDIKWEEVSEEKTNIAYENSVLYLKDLEEAQRDLDKKALVFLFYLFTILGVITYSLFFNFDKIKEILLSENIDPYFLMLFLSIGFSILFCLTAMTSLSTQKRKAKYANPYLVFRNPNQISQYIKNDLCIGLHEAISYNIKKQNRKSAFLKILLLLSVIFPVAIVSIFILKISTILTIVISAIFFAVLWFLFQIFM